MRIDIHISGWEIITIDETTLTYKNEKIVYDSTGRLEVIEFEGELGDMLANCPFEWCIVRACFDVIHKIVHDEEWAEYYEEGWSQEKYGVLVVSSYYKPSTGSEFSMFNIQKFFHECIE